MAHETILPAIQALLISDGMAPETAKQWCTLISTQNGGMVPLMDVARQWGIAARTAWKWVAELGIEVESRKGRGGSLVDYSEFYGAAKAAGKIA